MVKIQKSQVYPKPQLPPKIIIHNEQNDLLFSLDLIREAVLFLLRDFKVATHEVAIHFVNESKICELHALFFNDPSPTDCITFPIDSPNEKNIPYHVLGEAFICPKTAVNYAKEHGLDPFHELLRYLTHCLLHLIGYCDTEPQERARMKRKENACLKKILTHIFNIKREFCNSL